MTAGVTTAQSYAVQQRQQHAWQTGSRSVSNDYAPPLGTPTTGPPTTGGIRIRVARPKAAEDVTLRLLRRKEDWMSRAFIYVARALFATAITSAVIFWSSAAVGVWAAYDRNSALWRFILLSVGLLVMPLIYRGTRRNLHPEEPLPPHGEHIDQASPVGESMYSVGQSVGRVTQVLRTFISTGWDCGLLAGGLGLIFLLTHNWQLAREQDFTLLPWLTNWIQAQQPLWNDGLLLHENLVAGALIVLLPIAVVSLGQRQHTGATLYRYAAFVGTAIGALALILTFSRGAWFGLIAGALCAAYLHWRTDSELQARREQRHTQANRYRATYPRYGQNPRKSSRQRIKRPLTAGGASALRRAFLHLGWLDWLVGGTIVVGIGLLVSITLSPLLHDLLLRPLDGTYLEMNINSRIRVWQNALPLIQDYLYTGSGLGSTPMVLTSYVYLLHVPYFSHTHSLYLQVAVEQGLPGLIGLVGMIISAAGLGLLWLRFGNRVERRLAAGAWAALIALLIYGCTDAELYVGIFVPLLFLPFILLMTCAPWVETEELQEIAGPPAERQQRLRWATGIGMLIPMVTVMTLFLLPGSQARWLVNQATVVQTRQELALYSWPTWSIQDALRRSDAVDTARWVAQYEAVIQQYPGTVTAERRLGQILLAQGDYVRAEQLLSAAYAYAPRQRATSQLLGEVKALLGEQAEAVAIWRTVNLKQGQLDLRLWWYNHVGSATEIQRFTQAVEQLTELSGGTTDD